jgi:hypothetical protein
LRASRGDQRILGGRAAPGGDQQCAELVAVQPAGVRLIIQRGAPDVGGRRVIEEFFIDGVSVKSRDGAAVVVRASPTC